MKEQIYNQVCEILEEVIEKKKNIIDENTVLLGQGGIMDSLTITRFINKVESKFQVDIIEEDLELKCLETVGSLTEFLYDGGNK
ncbi:acyl carrier protein [Ruminiclostridium cellulolyticum]|uniref:Carrier domain-containing protein n=1 Tax=Ruminiclostridium cellulolyticum (strain ATCC 35319 / DSM 5812 / JCM 6584 / H10) TaxID=394503 RepID=B8HZU9_RUMCH|nr:acyl carrier protein [Ruminiclostridium cellulolyticum]ACL75449.1 conserved hypothetical protein [Ruminiclostridium cellulolyticum H10]